MISSTILRSCAALAICVAAAGMTASAQGIGNGAKASGANTTAEKASEKGDLPSPPSKIVIPSLGGSTTSNFQTIPDEAETDGPPVEIDDNPEEDEPPTFFGEPAEGTFVWCLDRSGSMSTHDPGTGAIEYSGGQLITNPTRLQVMKFETISVLEKLSEKDEFAIVHFGGCPTVTYYQALVKANEANRQQGINQVNALTAYGSTPAKPALNKATHQYGALLDKIFFLCDGEPNLQGTAQEILADFPNWYDPIRANGCEFVSILIGNSGPAEEFMTAIANVAGGTFIRR
jgi:hypothetical protein